MMDPRMEKLAELLIGHSVKLQKGEHVHINVFIGRQMQSLVVGTEQRNG